MRHAFAALALVLSSCGVGDRDDAPVVNAPSTPSYSVSRSDSSPPAEVGPGLFEAPLHGALIVAPDRALVTVQARVESTTRAATAELIRETANALRERASGAEGCSASIWSFGAVTREWGRRFESDEDREHRASATLRLDIALGGLDSPAARQTRIESCLAPLHAITKRDFPSLSINVGAPLITIDDPGAHRAALLERRFAALRAVSALTDPPAQFHASALRCTSNGQVTITERSLQGVQLAVDFTCAPHYASPPARAATVSESP